MRVRHGARARELLNIMDQDETEIAKVDQESPKKAQLRARDPGLLLPLRRQGRASARPEVPHDPAGQGSFEFHAPAQWQRCFKEGFRNRIRKGNFAIENIQTRFMVMN